MQKSACLNRPEIANYFQSLLSPVPNPNTNRIFPENSEYASPFSSNEKAKETTREYYNEEKPRKKSSFLNPFNPNASNEMNSSSQDKKKVNFTNIAKKLGEITRNVIASREKELYDEYVKGLSVAQEFLNMSKSKSPFLTIFKKILFLVFQIFMLFMNLMSVISMVLVTDYRLGVLDSSYEDSLKKLEWSISAFFLFELFLSVFSKKGKWYHKVLQLLNFNSITDVLMVIEIMTTTIQGENFKRISPFFVIVFVFRSIKIVKTKLIFQSTWKEISKIIKGENYYYSDLDSQNDLIYFVYGTAIDIVIGIFIQATFFMAVDEIFDYNAYTNGDNAIFDYITACYYSIVSLTTIGYGDIYPIRWESRLFTMFVLFINISLLSNFINKMNEKIHEISPYIRHFAFNNHIVIIGDLPVNFLKYFIKEVHFADSMNSDIYTQGNKEKKLSKILVVGGENPTKELATWLENFSNDYVETKYLKANFLNEVWYKNANLSFARHLFAFSMKLNESREIAFEYDKKMAYNIQTTANFFPNLKISLVLSTDFAYQIKKDSLWEKINVISAQIINEYIMANSLENQGLNTFLTHLATLREKKLPGDHSLSNLEEYAINMAQELYPINLPPIFIEKTFQEALKIAYFSSIDLSESFNIDYYSPNPISNFSPKKSGLLLLGIEYKDEETNELKFLINPINYRIKHGDIGYVIAYDQEHAKGLSTLSKSSPNYSLYEKNLNFFKRFKVEKTSPPLLQKLNESLNLHYENWSIDKEKFLRKYAKNQSSSNNFNLNDIPHIFNLFLNISPKGVFQNHIIIKGNIFRLAHILLIIRSYSQRPVVFFSEENPNLSEWNKLREVHKNIFYVQGKTTNVNHINQLDPKKAFKILILSIDSKNFILDSENIVFTRIISDFFDLNNFLTELLDETNLKYLSINPKYPNLDYFYWPYFVKGSVHFSSVTMSIIAKTINNKNLLTFITNFSKAHQNNNFQTGLKESSVEQNQIINTFTITQEIVNEFQMFGHFQYALMTNTPQVIAIAILKSKSSQIQNVSPLNAKITRKITQIQPEITKLLGSQNINNEINKLMSKFYGSDFLMTNPSFLTPLEVGDKVLIIGNTESSKNNSEVMISSSIYSITKKPMENSAKKNAMPNTNIPLLIPDQNIKNALENSVIRLKELLLLCLNNWDDVQEKIHRKK